MVGIMISILYKEKLRHREVKSFVPGPTVTSVLEQGPNPMLFSPFSSLSGSLSTSVRCVPSHKSCGNTRSGVDATLF